MDGDSSFIRSDTTQAIAQLRARYPWPPERPEFSEDWFGWLADTTAEMLTGQCPPDARLIVECGTWKGLSAKALLLHAPAAHLICIDTWLGSPEHQPASGNQLWADQLPDLIEHCRANLWPWRDRVTLLRANSPDGLKELAELGLSPDFFYIDSEHSFDHVTKELNLITLHWPGAIIVGDDYNNAAVKLAADTHATITGRRMVSNPSAFCFPGSPEETP